MSYEQIIERDEEYNRLGRLATQQVEAIIAELPVSMMLDVVVNVAASLCLSHGKSPLVLAQQIAKNLETTIKIYQARAEGKSA